MATIHMNQSRPARWSLAMIVKDAEAQIEDVLRDASSFCEELIVVDTGSSDSTRELAAKHGAKVIEFEWIDDFAAARNVSFEHCTGDWILWLDADDRIPEEAQRGFANLKRELTGWPEVDVVMIPYRVHFAQGDPSICTFSFERERVVRRRAGIRWFGPVHETVNVPRPPIRWPDAWVEHRPRSEDREHKVDRNLRILERAVAGGDRASRTLFYLGNELKDHDRWEDALRAYQEYLDTSETVVWERHAALLSMAVCSEMLGRQEAKLDYLFRAMRLDGSRAEAFLRVGLHHYERKEWQLAIPFFLAATSLPRPTDGFVDDTAYTWAPWDYLSICHSEMGMYQLALEETVKALRDSYDRERLFRNIDFYLGRLRGVEVKGSP
jgi:glycosyltransferase involved in cell wall biosynthesis